MEKVKKEKIKKEKNEEYLWEKYPPKPTFTNLKETYRNIPKKANPVLEDFATPHIKSFNWMVDEGLKLIIKDIPILNFELNSKERIALRISDARINAPCVPPGTISRDSKVYPTECRQRYGTYKGDLIVVLGWSIDKSEQPAIEKNMGPIPIMVRSNKCNLDKLSPKEMVAKGEHESEFGGYFIAKGHEKLIRMLLMTRANYPIFLNRSAWIGRGKLFTEKGILIRCVREDRSSLNNVLHYLKDGTVKLMFNVGRELFFVPIIMVFKALVDVTDEFIYKTCIEGHEDDMIFKGYLAKMLRDLHYEGIHYQHQAKSFIGKNFRSRIGRIIGDWKSDGECCDFLIEKGMCIQCKTPMEKFHFLVFALQKLYKGVQGRAIVENPDHVMAQEVLLGGHLFLQLIKEKLWDWLENLRFLISRKANTNPIKSIRSLDVSHFVFLSFKLERAFEAFIATGNVPLDTGRGLPQTTGLTIVVENLNRCRYLAHFRSIHRGSFFQELRTTECRQLQPDAFGFICCAHTPDGAPCGLLNHLTAFCTIANETLDSSKIPTVLNQLGMIPIDQSSFSPHNFADCYKVIMDGRVLGYILMKDSKKIVNRLRLLKINGDQVPKFTEIVLIPKTKDGKYPGLFIFTTLARMMRPVINLLYNQVEYIGTMEQLYLDICIVEEEAYPMITTHKEINQTSFLSHLANLIPMPDCNQSPRNMYQCQMSKQTMGTAWATYHRFAENKLYRLITPTTPFFRTLHYDYLNLDEYPIGTNAIVAVISYTGFDMEDAMIINKSSYERGFGFGCVYKSEHVDLKFILKNQTSQSVFGRDPTSSFDLNEKIDADGLPHIGIWLEKGDSYYSFYNSEEGRYVVKKFGMAERAYVDSVKLKSNDRGTLELNNVVIIFRIPKNPKMGDKFASRSGQKGICSYLWPVEDLPFSESGLVPDIVFNPHGFPSRMTIAMMLEVMAGKSGAVHGMVHDASPFNFSEEDTAADYFGKTLEKGGYNFYGTENLYSGTDGRMLRAEIFIGIVHYQRLRHMVSDKWQVRSTGPVDPITHQPNKGRRKGGGVRFGEMEKDCLISHGSVFLLQDRLFYGSDRTTTLVCTECGSIISPILKVPKLDPGTTLLEIPKPKCAFCGKEETVQIMEVPHVFRHFVDQLASCNIKLKIEITHV